MTAVRSTPWRKVLRSVLLRRDAGILVLRFKVLPMLKTPTLPIVRGLIIVRRVNMLFIHEETWIFFQVWMLIATKPHNSAFLLIVLGSSQRRFARDQKVRWEHLGPRLRLQLTLWSGEKITKCVISRFLSTNPTQCYQRTVRDKNLNDRVSNR